MSAGRDLEIRHLVALRAVAAEGTFARAAAHLGYTQSAVSQQIAALERSVGGAVFDRPGGPRPVTLTRLGELVLGHADGILKRVAAANDDIARFHHGQAGRLEVGTFQSVSTALLPLVVARMRAERPAVEIRLFESDLDEELIERLISGELDLSFVVGAETPGLHMQRLVEDPFVLLAPHGEFAPGPVPIAELANRPLIGQVENSCQRLNEAGLRSGGCEPQYVFRTNENAAVAALVRAGMGLAVLPKLCVEPEDPRLALHELDPPIPSRVITISWRADRELSPAAQHFVDLTMQVCAEMEPALV